MRGWADGSWIVRGKSPGTWKYTTGKIWVVINKAGNVVSVGRN